MSKEEIKKKLHKLVDEIQDESLLNILYEDAVEYKTGPSEVADDELTEGQWASIQKGRSQVNNGDFFTEEQAKEKLKEWRNMK